MTFPDAKVRAHIDETLQVAIARVKARAEELFTSEIASEGNGGASPFLKLLVPEAKVFSAFERSLSASLGKAFDYIGADIAQATYGNGTHDYHLKGSLCPEALGRIESIVAGYKKRPGTKPDTSSERDELVALMAAHPHTEARDVKNDLFFIDDEGTENYLEIKTVEPNYDVLTSVKTRILTIHCIAGGTGRRYRALVAFPYNPNGLAGVYAWPPTRYFLDPQQDWFARGHALMGPGLWNFIGNSEDTYDKLLACFYEVSRSRKTEVLELLRLTDG